MAFLSALCMLAVAPAAADEFLRPSTGATSGCAVGATADFYQYNIAGPTAEQVPGLKVSDGYVFSWLNKGMRKMAKTNADGQMIACGNVPASSSTWYDTSTWSSFRRNNHFGYYVKNFRCLAVAPIQCSDTAHCTGGLVCAGASTDNAYCQERGHCAEPMFHPGCPECNTTGLGEQCKSTCECMPGAVCVPSQGAYACKFAPGGSRSRASARGARSSGPSATASRGSRAGRARPTPSACRREAAGGAGVLAATISSGACARSSALSGLGARAGPTCAAVPRASRARAAT